MTIDAYRALFESSVVFGVRKQLQAEDGMGELESTASTLQEGTAALEAKVLALKNRLMVLERRHRERRELDDKARREEKDFLAHQQKHLDAFVKTLSDGR